MHYLDGSWIKVSVVVFILSEQKSCFFIYKREHHTPSQPIWLEPVERRSAMGKFERLFNLETFIVTNYS